MTISAPVAGPATTTAPGRLHGLDALRALALGLGIVLHSLLAFVPGIGWLITDSVTSPTAFLPVYVIHLFRMTVFMLLAGYFGAMVLQRRGAPGYLKDRLLRIGLPLVAFWPIAVASLGIVAVIGAEVRGLPMPTQPPSRSDLPPVLLMITPGQLWFLLVLLECVLITLAVRWVARRVLGVDRVERITRAVGTALSSRFGVLLAAIPYAAAMLVQGSAGGILEPATIVPSAPALIGYLGGFWTGWALHARTDGLTRAARGWPIPLLGGVVAAGLGLVFPGEVVPLPVAVIISALAGMGLTYGLLGAFTTVLNRRSAVVRYLADASYWVYLLHLPVLLAVHIPLADLPWPILVKLPVLWAITAVILLVSYDVIVRSTWVGRWLNGHRRRSVILRRG